MATKDRNSIELAKVVSRDPDVHSGDLVFAGTRVPVQTLVDYLTGGASIGEFLESFPTVERWQVESYLDYSPEAIDHLRTENASPA
ncbi:MAG: DUF433 domain-containing protein [Caldilineaceae bacterium SB0670_bin_27]|uniref:DUF433 domain-containing protein n=1 Tax=Caldilineaceae bacterium SB0664_bin_27 TaxID=2605260 RepID=A0A6B0YXT3_9CHLR|nr:DUF433 domain-containing protein [Caldilineaceae bacterium SB0664_bin_27]MYJ78587.1 DUF433 domain-containing protein [Caldilineaceae bacterium SB0670_bin_27]